MLDDAVYLNGLAEAAGELRRHVLDTIRRGELGRAEEISV
jgi:translin